MGKFSLPLSYSASSNTRRTDWSSFAHDSTFRYPYPKTRWCKPPKMDVTTHEICKPLPPDIYPAPPVKMFRPIGKTLPPIPCTGFFLIHASDTCIMAFISQSARRHTSIRRLHKMQVGSRKSFSPATLTEKAPLTVTPTHLHISSGLQPLPHSVLAMYLEIVPGVETRHSVHLRAQRQTRLPRYRSPKL